MADDWDTDPYFVNDVTEKQHRWGSKTVAGSGRQAYIDMHALREEVKETDRVNKLKTGPKPSFGYGGKFGVERDRMDKSAVGHDYVANVAKHGSQTDSKLGFGGKFGVQRDRQDKCAVGWGSQEKTALHASQTDGSIGFGGKYGVQTERSDTTMDQPDQPASSKPVSLTDSVPTQKGNLQSLLARFENVNISNGSQSTNTGMSVAQQRVLAEKSRWEAERATQPDEPKAEQPHHQQPPEATIPTPFEEAQLPLSPPMEEKCPYPATIPTPFEEGQLPPITSMEEERPLPEQIESPSASVGEVVSALYDYFAVDDDELTSVGNLITNVERIVVNWWLGVLNYRTGLFPANYVTKK